MGKSEKPNEDVYEERREKLLFNDLIDLTEELEEKNKIEENEQDNLYIIEKELKLINNVFTYYKNYDNTLFTNLTFDKFLKFLNRKESY